MKSTILKLSNIAAMAALPLSLGLAQPSTPPNSYTIVNLGAPFGGSFASAVGFGPQGVVGGYDVIPPSYNTSPLLWTAGSAQILGTYGGPNGALLGGTSGFSETLTPDPLGQDFCETGTFLICLAFGAPFNLQSPLPTLGGNNAVAFGNNSHGQIVGAAQTTFLDPSCLIDNEPQPPFYSVQQLLPAVWKDGQVTALPTFSGDTFGKALWSNDRGQVVGFSGNCVTNQEAHALLWDHGKAINLGGFGGIYGNNASGINSLGEVVGNSDLTGDTAYHAFLWRNGVLKDIGTLPGDVSSYANQINDQSVVIGGSCNASGSCRQVVWINGKPADINKLTPPHSDLYLLSLNGINNSGEIAGYAISRATGTFAAFLAIPGPPAGQLNDDVAPALPTLPPDLRRKLISGSVR